MSDGALLVALAGRTPYDVVQRAAATLGQDRIFGIVLNGVAESALPHSYDQAYYGLEKY
jgi:Mrp family chromosome partitioning ATPase